MSPSAGKKRKLFQVFVLALVLVALVSYYFLAYLPQQNQRLISHKSRQLQKLHKNLQTEIKLVRNWLNAVEPPLQNDEVAENGSKNRERRLQNPIHWVQKDSNLIVADSAYFNAATHELVIRRKADANDTAYLIWSKEIGEILKPFLPFESCEGFVVFHNNRVCFETFPSGILSVHPDSLGVSDIKGIAASTRKLNIRGEPYLAMVEPWAVNPSETLFIVALQKQSNFNKQAGNLPQTLVIFLILLALAAIMLLPWLRVYFSGNTEQLVFRHYWQLYLSAWVFSAIVAYVGLRIWKENQFETSRQILLRQEADKHGNLLESRFKSYREFLASAKNNRLLDSIDFQKRKQISLADFNEESAIQHSNISTYLPEFQRLFFINQKGEEWLSINKDQKRTSNANFADRPYFREAIQAKIDTTTSYEFVKSWLDGEKRLVLAQNFNKDNVAAISVNLKQPFLDSSSNIQFAVADGNGYVIFHSQASRELDENLLEETDQNQALQQLLQQRKQGKVSGYYHQKAFSGFVKPLNNTKWSLIAISLDLPFEHAMANSFYFMLLLALGLLLIQVLVLCAVKHLGSKPYFAQPSQMTVSWILPHKGHTIHYLTSGIFHLLLLACLFSVYFNRAFAYPISSLLLVLLAGLLGMFQLQLGFLIENFQNPIVRQLKIKLLSLLVFLVVFFTYLLLQLSNSPLDWVIVVGILFLLLPGVGLSFFNRLFSIKPGSSWAIPAFSILITIQLTLLGFVPSGLLYLHAFRMEFTSLSGHQKSSTAVLDSSENIGNNIDFEIWSKLRFYGKYTQSLDINQYKEAVITRNFALNTTGKFMALLCLGLIWLAAVSWVIQKTLKRMSGASLPDFQPDTWLESDQYKFLFSNNNLLILEGLPGTNKLSFFKLKANIQANGDLVHIDLFGANTVEKVQACFQKAIEEAPKHSRWILIQNFETSQHLAGLTQTKFEQLATLLAARGHHIALFTTKSLAGMGESGGEEKSNLTYILRNFLVLPIGFSRNNALPEKLQKECLYGTFLGNLAQSSSYWMPHFEQQKGFQKEQGILMEIQWRASHYYHAIWEALSFEEQLLIFDLAQDQLVHCGSTATLSKLMKKGLIVRNPAGRLSLFNKSFAVYLLSSISEENANKIKNHISATGAWETIKVPLLFSAGALLVFLAGSKQELLQQTEQQLAAYATAGALLWKMIGYLGNPFTK